MTGWDRAATVIPAAAAVVAILLAAGAQRQVHDLTQQRSAPCAFLRAAALAPGAHAAPQDAGSLSNAAAARESYLAGGCDEAGWGDLPQITLWPSGR